MFVYQKEKDWKDIGHNICNYLVTITNFSIMPGPALNKFQNHVQVDEGEWIIRNKFLRL